MPWLEFLGWMALVGFIACWMLHAVPVVAGAGLQVSLRAKA